MRPRLYLDEDVIPELARLLRSRGSDAVSVHELGALGLPDEVQLARAVADGRAILTFNYQHFIALGLEWFQAARPHPGIIVSYHQYRRQELSILGRAVLALLDTLSAENLRNSIQVLDYFRRG